MFRRIGLLLTAVIVAAGLLPASGTVSADSTGAYYLSVDAQTQGDWVGVYGADGYVLPFFATNLTNGRDDPLADAVVALPDYVDSYSRKGDTYWAEKKTNDPVALLTPDGNDRKRFQVYGSNITYRFNLNDNDPHQFTVYTTDYKTSESIAERFEILNLSNQVLASVDLNTINGGKYVTFQVQGSFQFKATKLAGYAAYAEGYFFDEPLPSTAGGLTAVNMPGRQAELSWTDSATTETAVLRKRSDEDAYTKIAVVQPGITVYTDIGLVPGEQYTYALQNVVGTFHSVPSAAATLTVPEYTQTQLVYLDDELEADEPGQTVTLAVYYTDTAGTRLAGQPVTFTLAGEYVGTYIEADIGTVSTDVYGRATMGYSPPFAGAYTVRASVPPNDDEELNQASAEASLAVAMKAWQGPPVLMRATDTVKPGMLFTVSGHAMIADDWDDVQVAMEPLATAGMTPSAAAIEPEAVRFDELSGQFVQLTMPENAAPGQYRLWVRNAHGRSDPITLNAPRPLFISEYEVFEGLSIDLSGRNLLGSEFGDAAGETLVRLNGGSAVYPMTVTELTPYSLRFLVEGAPLGEYEVEVSNDGGLSWHGLQSGQTLTVLPVGDDPLGLGVAWAAHFAWDEVFDVTDYGAVADDDANDTAAIAAAVAAAKLAGGGVVYFPAGAYHADEVGLPSGIVLMGEGPESSLLYHTGGSGNFIHAAGDGKTVGRTGIARLGLRAADTSMYPDTFIWFGHDWGSAVDDSSLRTASELFVFETSIDYPVLSPPATGSGRGQGMIAVSKERFLFKNNRTVGWAAQYNRVYMNEYVYSSGNYMEYAFSGMPITADYTFIRDNEIVLRGESDLELHGIGVKHNSHVENNIVRTLGAAQKTTYNNDGESIFLEMPGSYFSAGEVLGATADTITVAPRMPLGDPGPLRHGKLSMMIVDGTGLGQLREVEFVSGTTYSLKEDWEVVPDRSSKFTLIAPNDNVTVYRNEAIDGQRGIWLYGNVVDAIVADNRLVRTDGIYVASTGNAINNRYTPTYYVNVKGNLLLGTPGEEHASGIITVSNRKEVEGKYYASGVYGIEVRDNYLYGSKTPVSTPRHQKISGIVSSAATLSSDSSPVFTPEDRDNLNIIFENNRMEQMLEGLVLTSGLYGHTAKGNEYVDVDTAIKERNGEGTSHILVTNDVFADKRAPFWPAFAGLTADRTDGETAVLTWEDAADSVGVVQYKIYFNGTYLAQVGADTLTYTADSLQASMDYTFEVTAVDAAGNESYVPIRATAVAVSDRSGSAN